MGLLKMPKMPELKGRKITGFVAPSGTSPEDLNSIKYTNKAKETSRQEKLQAFQQTGNWPGAAVKKKQPEAVAWSQKVGTYRCLCA